ncbi:LytR C-terminal domain-containing protein [Clavibacter tessellarius]|uniref:LytR C-terminal domain-containing protein n=1 Tax=Clavibacter tessellarius TaxID=31965 RepID=UPI00325313DE
MPSHAPDRFDDVPGDLSRVGAHRAPRPRHHRFRAFAWAALATGLLVGLGVVGLFVIDDRVSFTDIIPNDSASEGAAAPTEAPTVAPTTVPGMVVTVLNGTRTSGLSAKAATSIQASGWKIGSRLNASTNDIATTTVYYYDAADEGAARGSWRSSASATCSSRSSSARHRARRPRRRRASPRSSARTTRPAARRRPGRAPVGKPGPGSAGLAIVLPGRMPLAPGSARRRPRACRGADAGLRGRPGGGGTAPPSSRSRTGRSTWPTEP